MRRVSIFLPLIVVIVVPLLLIPTASQAYTHPGLPLPSHWTIDSNATVLHDSNHNEHWFLSLNQTLASTQAEAQAIAAELAGSNYGGFSTWHLATRQEINHLLDNDPDPNMGTRMGHLTDVFAPSYDTWYYGAAEWRGWTAEPWFDANPDHPKRHCPC
jgi:hypothetical protein